MHTAYINKKENNRVLSFIHDLELTEDYLPCRTGNRVEPVQNRSRIQIKPEERRRTVIQIKLDQSRARILTEPDQSRAIMRLNWIRAERRIQIELDQSRAIMRLNWIRAERRIQIEPDQPSDNGWYKFREWCFDRKCFMGRENYIYRNGFVTLPEFEGATCEQQQNNISRLILSIYPWIDNYLKVTGTL